MSLEALSRSITNLAYFTLLICQMDPISQYEDSVADHLSKILHCEDHQVIISSAKLVSLSFQYVLRTALFLYGFSYS